MGWYNQWCTKINVYVRVGQHGLLACLPPCSCSFSLHKRGPSGPGWPSPRKEWIGAPYHHSAISDGSCNIFVHCDQLYTPIKEFHRFTCTVSLQAMTFTIMGGGQLTFHHKGTDQIWSRSDSFWLLEEIQPYVLAENPVHPFKLDSGLVGWILDLLTDRSQWVRENRSYSNQLHSSTDSPQSCCLSPLLSILYTNDCHSNHKQAHYQTCRWLCDN